jgi:peptidase E
MTKTAVLLGNGIFDTSIRNYKDYVDDFVHFANKNKVDKVIVSGGYTDAKADDSEAASLKRYIAPRIDRGTKLLTESRSITASQSIKYTKPMLKMKASDDVTVFCDSVIAVKVMWFIMHYWFGMSRKEIEDDALNFVATHYSKRNRMEVMGKWIGVTGVFYKNVEVHPCIVKPSLAAAIAQQLVSLVDVAALYDPKLSKRLAGATRQRYGLKK